MTTVLVRYIGLKPSEMDKKARTGLVWVGHGAVHPVPIKAWDDYLSKHPDVWELADVAGGLSDAKPAAAPNAGEMQAPAGKPPHVAEMDEAALRAFAKANSLKIDGRKKGEALRAAVLDAMVP